MRQRRSAPWRRTPHAKVKQQRQALAYLRRRGVGELRLEIGVKRGPIRPASRELYGAASFTTFALVCWRQLTSHMGKLKVPELCLTAFTAAWAIDGNARRSSAG